MGTPRKYSGVRQTLNTVASVETDRFIKPVVLREIRVTLYTDDTLKTRTKGQGVVEVLVVDADNSEQLLNSVDTGTSSVSDIRIVYDEKPPFFGGEKIKVTSTLRNDAIGYYTNKIVIVVEEEEVQP